MSMFDAIGHSFSTIAIGGFSTHDASIGYYASPTINTIIAIFLLISGCNYGLHFALLSGRSLKVYWRDPEFRMFIAVQLTLVVVCTGVLWGMAFTKPVWKRSIRHSSRWCRWRRRRALLPTAFPNGRYSCRCCCFALPLSVAVPARRGRSESDPYSVALFAGLA